MRRCVLAVVVVPLLLLLLVLMMWREVEIASLELGDGGTAGDLYLSDKLQYRHRNLFHMFGHMHGEFLPAIADISAESAGLISRLLVCDVVAFVHPAPKLGHGWIVLVVGRTRGGL
jgi:hypothetical protein